MKKLVGSCIVILACVGILGVIVSLLISAALPTTQNFEGLAMVEMTAELCADTPGILNLTLVNNSESPFSYEQFALYRLNRGWQRVFPDFPESHSSIILSLLLSGLGPGLSNTRSVDLSWHFGSLPPGEYKIVKKLLNPGNPGDVLSIVAAYFEIE